MPKKKQYKKKVQNVVHSSGDKEVTHTGKSKTDSVVYRGIGIPGVFYTKVKYSDTYSFTTSPYQEHLMRMNSIFDPDYSFGGSQPMYYDELSLLYQNYVVLGCDISATFINKANTTEAAYAKVGIYPLGISTTASGLEHATERDNCTFAQLGPNTGDQGIISMNCYSKPYQVLGLNKSLAQDDTMSANFSANPSTDCLWHIFGGSLDGLTNVNIYIDIVITYYIKCYERNAIQRS